MIKTAFKDFLNKDNRVATISIGVATIVLFVFFMWLFKTPYMFTNKASWIILLACCIVTTIVFFIFNDTKYESIYTKMTKLWKLI